MKTNEKTLTCPNCGAKLEAKDYEESVRCPYCSTLLENINHDPDALDEETIERYKKEDEETTRKFHERMEDLKQAEIKRQKEEEKRNLKNGIFFIILIIGYALYEFIRHYS